MLTLASVLAALAVAVPAPPSRDFAVLFHQSIPMRDGAKLHATLFIPRDEKTGVLTRSPAVFTLSPYIADSYEDRARAFALRGFAFALVDVRGRGGSDGKFEPFFHEAEDGYDVVEWLAAQPWCTGKVAMWGGSYAGFDQWMTARERPPHLVTIVPAAAAYVGVDFPLQKNIFKPYAMKWLTQTSGVAQNKGILSDDEFWRGRFRALFVRQRPFEELDEIIGNVGTPFREWLAHPTPDAYWQRTFVTVEQYRALTLPILTITGAYDDDQYGALTYYKEHAEHGDAKNHFLIIGPWNHSGTRTPQRSFGGLAFGPESMVNLTQLHDEWYRFAMGERPRPSFLDKRVRYYVAGDEAWRSADTLPSITVGAHTLALPSGGYTFDPLDTSVADVERTEVKDEYTDQRYVQQARRDGWVWTSKRLSRSLLVAGAPRLSLTVSLDVPDTDISVALYEVQPDGKSLFLAGDTTRVRYRDSLLVEQLAVSGQPMAVRFDAFNWFARRLKKGSAVRVVVRPSHGIWAQKNFNAGGVVAKESGKDARTAHVRFHEGELALPLGEP